MNKEFIPYEEALALKELGFIEPVIAYFKKEKYNDNPEWLLFPSGDPDIQIRYQQGLQNSHPELGLVSAPTYSQAFRWFRENNNLISSVDCLHYGCELKMNRFIYKIVEKTGTGTHDVYDTYEEAELACLKKLIEIVKEKK